MPLDCAFAEVADDSPLGWRSGPCANADVTYSPSEKQDAPIRVAFAGHTQMSFTRPSFILYVSFGWLVFRLNSRTNLYRVDDERVTGLLILEGIDTRLAWRDQRMRKYRTVLLPVPSSRSSTSAPVFVVSLTVRDMVAEKRLLLTS